MNVLVMTDIHANLEALEAVLADAGAWDALWFLGDAVGYGPDPVACVERLLELRPTYWLAGNHDWAALGRLDISDFNPDARRAAEWTRRQLSPLLVEALLACEPRADVPELDLCLVHGSPRHPIWEYVLNAGVAHENFEAFEASLCLFGHTHVPAIYSEGVDGTLRLPFPPDEAQVTEPDARWMVNPGGVGQPRDGDPRASYLLFDTETRALRLRRVAYPLERTQEKILDAGLPPRLAARLAYGW
jgi:predicted phosphodiesterase